MEQSPHVPDRNLAQHDPALAELHPKRITQLQRVLKEGNVRAFEKMCSEYSQETHDALLRMVQEQE